ncbi:DUF1643 domain-containing protein [Pseudomonas aeruginosa]|uniref:DUF1643 domain-containing protein n=1 Tax=Pseudomonas aeruginosa TaxID=287 RepID=UPI0009A50022|nr:DUF1643 domain-containing protein [Pseudomonas aeruginosa]
MPDHLPYTLHLGDCLQVLKTFPDNSFDSVVTDPPYGIRFMGKAWGCNGIAVVNLYALRATNPADLWKHDDPIGPDNDWHLRAIAREYTDIVCAWGANAKPERVEAVTSILTAAGGRLWCLGTTKDGHPRHPLYVRENQALLPWAPRVTPCHGAYLDTSSDLRPR